MRRLRNGIEPRGAGLDDFCFRAEPLGRVDRPSLATNLASQFCTSARSSAEDMSCTWPKSDWRTADLGFIGVVSLDYPPWIAAAGTNRTLIAFSARVCSDAHSPPLRHLHQMCGRTLLFVVDVGQADATPTVGRGSSRTAQANSLRLWTTSTDTPAAGPNWTVSHLGNGWTLAFTPAAM